MFTLLVALQSRKFTRALVCGWVRSPAPKLGELSAVDPVVQGLGLPVGRSVALFGCESSFTICLRHCTVYTFTLNMGNVEEDREACLRFCSSHRPRQQRCAPLSSHADARK